MPVNLIVGNDGTNSLQGTAGADLIYGYDPNGPQSQATAIVATRVATGLSQPLFAGAPPGDTGRLFLVEKTGQIKILDLTTGQVARDALPRCVRRDLDCRRARPARSRVRSRLRHQRLFLRRSDQPGGRRRNSPLSRIGESERRRRRERHADHHHRPDHRHQPQGRLARLRSRRLSLQRDRRRRQHADRRTGRRRPARQDPADRRAWRRLSRRPRAQLCHPRRQPLRGRGGSGRNLCAWTAQPVAAELRPRARRLLHRRRRQDSI